MTGLVLVVLGGAPGTGKTTLAHGLARELAAAHVRVDTVEQAILRSSLEVAAPAESGYGVAMAVAADCLRVGASAVADAVNPVLEAWAGWRDVASATGARLVELVLHCSDPDEHRARVEQRSADIPGLRLPTWADVAPLELWAPASADRLDTARLAPGVVLERALAIARG